MDLPLANKWTVKVHFFVGNDCSAVDLTRLVLVAGIHSIQACNKSYRLLVFVLDQGHRHGGKDAQRNASHHHPVRGHHWRHGSFLWRASAASTRPLVSQLLIVHSRPALARASITTASAAGSRFKSAIVS